MKRSTAKAAPSRAKRATKKRANTGKSASRKAKASPRGQKPFTPPKNASKQAKKSKAKPKPKPVKPAKAKAVSSVPGKPRRKPPIGKSWLFNPDAGQWVAVKLNSDDWRSDPKQATHFEKRGKQALKGALRVSQPKGARAPLSEIRAWLGKRKHAEWWRNRDGSYNALVTFYGESAYEQLQRAMRKLPTQGAYFAIRLFRASTVEAVAKSSQSAGIVKGTKILVPESTPTMRADNEIALNLALSHVYSTNDVDSLYQRQCGLALYWNRG